MENIKNTKGIKIGFIVIVIVILVVAIITIVKLFILNNSDVRVMTGNLLYGTSATCTGDGSCGNYGMGGDAMTRYTCAICKKSCMNGTTNTPEICDECAKITNRHAYCGKLLKNN